MVSQTVNGNGNRFTELCPGIDRPVIEVIDVHVSRAPVNRYWPKLDVCLLPTSRPVRLKTNQHVVAMVKGRFVMCAGVGYVVADARNSEWIGPEGGNYFFGLAEQLEAESLFLEGL